MTDYDELVSRLRTAARVAGIHRSSALFSEAASAIEVLTEQSPSARLAREFGTLVTTEQALHAMGLGPGDVNGEVRVRAGGPLGVPEADDGPTGTPGSGVTVYTDGACSQGGIGGWAWWVDAVPPLHASGSEPFTTNNAMELTAAIEALGSFDRDVELTLVVDSAYVVNCFTERWFDNWRANGWRNSKKQPVENAELWHELLAQVEAHRAPIHWVHTRGHNRGADEHKAGNNAADKLAVQARLDLAREHDQRWDLAGGPGEPGALA